MIKHNILYFVLKLNFHADPKKSKVRWDLRDGCPYIILSSTVYSCEYHGVDEKVNRKRKVRNSKNLLNKIIYCFDPYFLNLISVAKQPGLLENLNFENLYKKITGLPKNLESWKNLEFDSLG